MTVHRLLERQLRRALALEAGQDPGAVLAALAAFGRDPALPEGLRGLCAGLGDLLARVDSTYAQHERDLALRNRSLVLSSEELTSANDRLRHDSQANARIVEVMRATANELLRSLGKEEIGPEANDLDKLSSLMAALVADRDRAVWELEQQKLALDAHAIVSVTDAQGIITYANDRFCAVSGYAREELLGVNHRIVKSGLHPPEVFDAMWATITAGRTWDGEICNRAKDGHLYWVSATIVPILGTGGRPEAYIAIRTDISRQKEMEGALAEQRRFLLSLTDSMGEGVYALDEAGCCLFLNPEGERLLGWATGELTGRVLHDVIHHHTPDGHFQPAADCPIMATVASGQVYRSEEQWFFRKDGTSFPVSVVAVPQRGGARIIGQVVVFQDISARKALERERREAERAIREARDLAVAASQAKGDFLANMSHEIRTPLNAVIGLSHLALEVSQNERERGYLSQIQISARSLLSVINDILDFSKIEAGRLTIENQEFALGELLAQVATIVSLPAANKGLELVLDRPRDVPEQLLGDAHRIKQILTNLAGNAVKFTKDGEVLIRVERDPEAGGASRLRFSVRDSGIGITPEQVAKLFQPFSQADTSTTRTYGGTGLGLAICKQLVELMGGTIGVASEAGVGSTFFFVLPLETGPRQQEAGPGPDLGPRGLRVLLADDNACAREVLGRQLEDAGLACDACGSLAEAEARLGAGAHAILLLDAALAGLEAPATLARLQAHAKVVLLVPCGKEAPAMPGSGAAPVLLAKPVLPGGLLDALREALGQTRRAAPKPPAAGREGPAPQGFAGASVLLVEDHPVNRLVAREMLSRKGLQVTCAENGVQAVEMLNLRAFDLVLMDVQMPELDGYEATRRIRASGRHPDLPIIALTAHAMDEARERCFAAGMDDHLSKPIQPDLLMAKLVRWLGSDPPAKAAVADPQALARAAAILPRLAELIGTGDLQSQDVVVELCAALAGGPLAELALDLKGRLEDFDFPRAAAVLQDLQSRWGTAVTP